MFNPDPSDMSICPRCGKRFVGNDSVERMNKHAQNCTDIDEAYRGEIDEP